MRENLPLDEENFNLLWCRCDNQEIINLQLRINIVDLAKRLIRLEKKVKGLVNKNIDYQDQMRKHILPNIEDAKDFLPKLPKL